MVSLYCQVPIPTSGIYTLGAISTVIIGTDGALGAKDGAARASDAKKRGVAMCCMLCMVREMCVIGCGRCRDA